MQLLQAQCSQQGTCCSQQNPLQQRSCCPAVGGTEMPTAGAAFLMGNACWLPLALLLAQCVGGCSHSKMSSCRSMGLSHSGHVFLRSSQAYIHCRHTHTHTPQPGQGGHAHTQTRSFCCLSSFQLRPAAITSCNSSRDAPLLHHTQATVSAAHVSCDRALPACGTSVHSG